jgi:hypothetical protein
MPSTYTLNNGIELIGTGEQSGTWGDTTNTNLGLLDVALDGQVTVALASAGSSGSPNSLPITDGTASNGRNRMVVFSDSGDLGATAYVQLTPNDAEKIIYIRNSLSGSRSVILFQGTYNASNDYEVPAGTTAVVYFDGAGAGAVAANVFNNAYFDGLRLGSVSVTAILDEDNMASDSATALATQQSIKAYVDAQVGTVDTLAEILAIGNTTGATDIAVDSAQKVQFRDAAIYINSSVDGQLDIVADTEIQIAATTIDVNGALDVSGTALVTGVLTTTAATVSNGGGQFNGAINVGVDDTGYDVKFFGATTGKSLLWDESADSLIVTGPTSLQDGLEVGVDDTGYDVKFFGATAGAYMLWDESADDLILGGAAGLSVNSTALVTGVLTTTAATVHTGGITMPDNAKAIFGAGSDFQLYHDGANNVIGVTTGDLYVQSNGGTMLLQPTAGEQGIGIYPNSTVNLYYDNAVKLATTATGIDVTGTVVAGAGTALLPSITTTGDLNTGMWFPAADTIAFSEGGVEALRIDSSGNVGIGTSSPSYKLHVSGSQLYLTNSGNTELMTTNTSGGTVTGGIQALSNQSVRVGSITDYTVEMVVNNSVKMTIDSSGDVGIGMTPTNFGNGYTVLQVANASNGGMLYLTNTANAGGRIYGNGAGLTYDAFSTTYHAFNTNSAERMRIDSSGRLFLNQTAQFGNTPQRMGLKFDGDTEYGISLATTSDTGSAINFANAAGTQIGRISVSASATGYITSSDYRLKTDVQPMSGASDRVLALKPVNFAWIVSGDRVDGFLAHETQEVVPEAIDGTKDAMCDEEYEVTAAIAATYDEDGNELTAAVEAVMGTRSVPYYQGIDQSKLVPLLTAALQEALTKIADMEIRLSALEG